MAPLPKWTPRETLIDLYEERDRTAWYWRTAAILSAAVIMLGYLIFPTSFPNNHSDGLSASTSGLAAGLLLALGYVVSVITAFACKSWLFQMDVIFVPCLFSCVLGLINVIITLGTSHGEASKWSGPSIAAIIVASISSAVYLTLALYTFRRIHMVRNRDAMHRHNSGGESYHLVPEDEMQRQQLLRLLLQRENSKKPSPEAGQSTFHIDLPDSIRRTETHLTTPRNIYASREDNNNNNHISHSFTLPPLNPFSSMRAPSPYQSIPVEDLQQPSSTTPPLPPQQSHTPPLQSHSRQHSTSRIQRNFSESSRAPPYSALSNHGSMRFPTEKEQQTMTNTLNGDIHPLVREREEREREREERERERPQYRVIESSPVQDLNKLMDPARRGNGGRLGRQRSTSRESRRAEIELERGKGKGEERREGRAELEGVKVSPRIMRVETDGWGKR
ncbi:MAG: hypothetical protein L6R37_001367 [Teloschistes peruensis]|nr:MAG: hypothetical protein L6R37_001367 [Teloschistes peruensis]